MIPAASIAMKAWAMFLMESSTVGGASNEKRNATDF
jgi:hypothetical protein